MATEVSKEKKVSIFEKRIHEIDFFRGILIILVVLDHLLFNIYHLDTSNTFFEWYAHGEARNIIQPLALIGFCFVSGVSCVFSKNNWKRSIECIILWAVIALGSNLIQLLADNGVISGNDPEYRIDFNIIGVLGFSMLFYCFIQKRSWKALLAAVLIGFILSTYILPTLRIWLAHLCGNWYQTYPRPGNDIYYGDFRVGNPNFYFPFFWEPKAQADYVPLFPYCMFFFLGTLFSYFIYKPTKKSIFKHRYKWEKPICFVGRHTLVIYLGQLIVLIGIFSLLSAII